MEEILASIRRIISEEGSGPGEGEPGTPPPESPAPKKEDVLELTDVVQEDGSVTSIEEAPPRVAPEPEPHDMPRRGEDGLLSEAAASASAVSLAELAAAVARREAPRGDIPLGRADQTLEGLVAELLRPFLREWLDQHLPGLIERLVRQEIERLVRRAEGR
jgi:cell pole-organizing protein PopZ